MKNPFNLPAGLMILLLSFNSCDKSEIPVEATAPGAGSALLLNFGDQKLRDSLTVNLADAAGYEPDFFEQPAIFSMFYEKEKDFGAFMTFIPEVDPEAGYKVDFSSSDQQITLYLGDWDSEDLYDGNLQLSKFQVIFYRSEVLRGKSRADLDVWNYDEMIRYFGL